MYTMLLDPLEQFDVLLYCKHASNLSTTMFIVFIMFIFFADNFSDPYAFKNKNFFIQSLLGFIRGIIKNTLQVKKKYIFFFMFLIFMYILFCNVIGLVPYTFTVTSSLIVTFFIAATFFGGINIISIYLNKWQFLNLFMPKGVPLIITPFLVPIELISYFSRVVSLSVRLFANMMSGHTLLKILVGFLWAFFLAVKQGGLSKIFIIIGILPWTIILMVLALESAIAFLQAYVFVTLITIYLQEGINLH